MQPVETGTLRNDTGGIDALLRQLTDAIRIDAACCNNDEPRLDALLAMAAEALVLEQEWRRYLTRNAAQLREELDTSLGRLRAYRTESELLDQICIEASRGCGTDRAFFGCIDRGIWFPRQSFDSGDPRGSALKQGDRLNVAVDELPLESELVGQLETVVVNTAERRKQAPPPVQEVMQNNSFVITPIPSAGNVVGALYVPCSSRNRWTDRDEIITSAERFATGVSRIWDRMRMASLVEAQRSYVHNALLSADRVMTSFDTAVDLVQLAGREQAGPIEATTESSTTLRSTLENQMTAREREVMALVSMGNNDNTIAQELAIAPSTVKSHIRNTMRKFGAVNRADLISRYYGLPEVGR
ncbi:LuxR C-terminal-related transcriptional regulator (plasmid) [Rhodococcus opacus]|uniref:LuxR C-terminal-related transcriptional regulator n=1 Tax=Rhodococcus opacus TaxID=37919 RepID=UPI0034D2CBC2